MQVDKVYHDLWGLTETQPSTREHGEARHRSPYMFVNIQLSLHKDPQTIGAEAASVFSTAGLLVNDLPSLRLVYYLQTMYVHSDLTHFHPT